MEKGWVMSEEERRKMMEQRKDKKNKMMQNSSQGRNGGENVSLYSLSEEDRTEISRIVNLYKKAYAKIPYEGPSDTDNDQVEGFPRDQTKEVMHPWITFCKRMAVFFSFFEDFARLPSRDQHLLLKTAITSAGIIMGSVVYDSANGKWSSKNRRGKGYSPMVSSQSVEKFVPGDLFSRISQFFNKFQQICTDETMAYILILVSLYSPELMGLEAKDRVQSLQERYIHILQNYVKFKFREKSSIIFPKAIVSLADIRELADRTSQMKIQQQHFSGASASPSLMFANMLNTSSYHMPSPYTEIPTPYMAPPNAKYDYSNQPQQQPQLSLSDTLSIGGEKNDQLYHKLLSYICQPIDLSSGKNPPLLPVIVQVLKRLALAHQEGRTSRAITAGSTPTSRRVHRHSRAKAQKSYTKRKEKRLSSTPNQIPVMIKEEVLELDEASSFSPLSSSPGPTSTLFPTTTTVSDYIVTLPQQTDYLQTTANTNLQQTQQSNNTSQQPTGFENQHHHQMQSIYPSQQTSDLMTSGNLFFEDSSSPLTVTTSPQSLYISPISVSPTFQSLQQAQPNDMITQMSEAIQMPAVSPYSTSQISSPSANLGSFQQVQLQQQQSDSNSSFGGQMLSPYASSSSSSSPEEIFEGDPKDVVINDPEMDMINNLLEKLGNTKGIENDQLLREVLMALPELPVSLKMNAVGGSDCSQNTINTTMANNITEASGWYSSPPPPTTTHPPTTGTGHHRNNCTDFSSSSFPSEMEMELGSSLMEEELTDCGA